MALSPSSIFRAVVAESESAYVKQDIDSAIVASGRAKNIVFVRNQVLIVDEDNVPTPENDPPPNQQSNDAELNKGRKWISIAFLAWYFFLHAIVCNICIGLA